MDGKKMDFQIDWAMVFAVVKPEELVENANKFYNQKLMLAGNEEGISSDSIEKSGKGTGDGGPGGEPSQKFHLYKFTMERLNPEEQKLQNRISPFVTDIEKVGVFEHLSAIMKVAEQNAIFGALDETDIFLRAYLRTHTTMTSKSAFLCVDKAIKGLEQEESN